jgi:hypothetical protein
VQSNFIKGQTDEAKRLSSHATSIKWVSIRDDVKAWTLENWERWEDEKPAWINDAFKAAIDDDMIPPDSLRRMNGGGSARRRSSLGDLLGSERRRSSLGDVLGGARVAPTDGGEEQAQR